MLKKLAMIAATLFIGGICLGYVAYDVIAENVTVQIEENKDEED